MSASRKYNAREAQDRERVRGEHDELLVAHRQHRRHRVDREQHVGDLDQQQDREQRSGQPLAVDAREQLLTVEFVVSSARTGAPA